MTKSLPTVLSSLHATLLCTVACCCTSSLADVSVPSVFSDHMVLQRDLPIPVWGTASPGEVVSVTFGNQSRSVKAAANGNWRVDLDPTPASTVPQTLEISGSRMNLNPIPKQVSWLETPDEPLANGR